MKGITWTCQKWQATRSPILTEFKLQVSYKFGAGHMVNVRADSPDEMASLLQSVEQGTTLITDVGNLFCPPPPTMEEGMNNLAQGGVTGTVEYQGDTKVCAHGAMVYKTGMGRNGKQWKAFMCQAPKGQTCDPVWLR